MEETIAPAICVRRGIIHKDRAFHSDDPYDIERIPLCWCGNVLEYIYATLWKCRHCNQWFEL